jgi:site-specific recombinase XerC
MYTLLCSDLAIRSGTAALIAPQHYNRQARTLHFTTKGGAALTLPVTDQVRRMIESCDLESSKPFVAQLWTSNGHGCKPDENTKWPLIMRRAFTRLRKRLNFNRRIIPHDLRRTSAVAMLEATGDLRDVQAFLGHLSLHSTVIYLDHDLRPVKRHTLELIKRPRVEESEEYTA